MNWEKWRLIRERTEHHNKWLVSTHLNRPFSNIITHLLLDTNVTPNQISVFTSLISFLIFLSYAYGDFVLGGLLTQIVSIIDGVDGEIARVKNMRSRLGEVLDSVFDRLAEVLICVGIGLGVSATKGVSYAWPCSIISMIGFLADSYAAELVKTRTKLPLYEAIKGLEERLGFSLSDRGLKMLIICVLSIFGFPEFGILIVGLISLLYVSVKFSLWIKCSREVMNL